MSLWYEAKRVINWIKKPFLRDQVNIPLQSWPKGKAVNIPVKFATPVHPDAPGVTFNDPPDTESDFDKLYPLE